MSDLLSEEEQLERLQSWWKENGTMLLVGVVVIVAGFVGWRWYQDNARADAEAASDLYAAYVEAGSSEREAALAALAERAPGSSYHALALFDEAASLVERSDLEGAEALYQQVVDNPSDVLIEDLARLRLSATLQGLDRGEEALALLDGIRSAGYRRAALELKGDIHQARGEREAAHTAYSQALEAAEAGAQTQLLKLKAINTEGAIAETASAEVTSEAAEAVPTEEEATASEEAADSDAASVSEEEGP